MSFIAKFSNSNVSPANYQICGVTFSTVSTATVAEQVAAIILYFAQSRVCAAGTTLDEIQYRAPGSPGFVAQPYPVAEVAAANAAAVTDGFTTTPGTGAFPFVMGGGSLAPLGTSISVTEITAWGGPTGRGRHFQPFIASTMVAANGGVGSTPIASIINAWNEFMMGVKPGGGPATGPNVAQLPQVGNPATMVYHEITTIKPQPVFSNLESRRR